MISTSQTLGMTAAAGPHPIPHIDAGCGRIILRAHGSTVVFSELSSTYPLKLLSPRVDEDGVAVVYMLTYGGGLVGGDCVKLAVDVGHLATLVLLSQVLSKNAA
jgi:urease accessory protein